MSDIGFLLYDNVSVRLLSWFLNNNIKASAQHAVQDAEDMGSTYYFDME